MRSITVSVLCCLLSACYQSDAAHQKFKQEAALENIAVRLAREVAEGGVSAPHNRGALSKTEKRLLLIDVRAQCSYEEGHIAGAKNFTFPKGVIMNGKWDDRLMGGKALSDFEAFLGAEIMPVLSNANQAF